MKKSIKIIPQIIECKDRDKAIDILNQVLIELNLRSDYIHLNELKDRLDYYQKEFNKESDHLRELAHPRDINDLNQIRINLNFIYRDITDELSFQINKVKIYHEENKTAIRGAAMFEIAEDEEKQSKVKAKSASALRDIYGASEEYKQYVNEASISYGLYKNLENLLNAIKMMTDSIAAEVTYLRTVLVKNQS